MHLAVTYFFPENEIQDFAIAMAYTVRAIGTVYIK